MELASYAEKLRRMKNEKYFLVFVIFVFFLMFIMFSGNTRFRVGTYDGWMQVCGTNLQTNNLKHYFVQEQRRRSLAIEEVCQKLGSTPLNHEMFIFIPQYNLLYCMIPKVRL